MTRSLLAELHRAGERRRWIVVKGIKRATLSKAIYKLKVAGWDIESERLDFIPASLVDWYDIPPPRQARERLLTLLPKRDKSTTNRPGRKAYRLKAGQMAAVLEYVRRELRAGRLELPLFQRGSMEGFGL